MKISAVIITYNEESNIERCLDSLSFVDEIVVLDSFSTDKTVEIARRFTDRISQRAFTGFADQRNAAKGLASREWLLVIDADEVVPPALAREMRTVVESEGVDGYLVPRLTYFLGKPIRHCGWYPGLSVRLARKSKISFGDRLVHETISVDGNVGRLKNDLLHYSYDNMRQAMKKLIDYSDAAARQKYTEGRRFKLTDLLVRPGLTFLKHYVVQQGFRDGTRGLLISALAQCGVFLRYASLWEMSLRKEQDRD